MQAFRYHKESVYTINVHNLQWRFYQINVMHTKDP